MKIHPTGSVGPGRLRLGSMTSQYLIWSEYKKCRGKECVGPCPEHQEAWYNALDALGPCSLLARNARRSRYFND